MFWDLVIGVLLIAGTPIVLSVVYAVGYIRGFDAADRITSRSEQIDA